MGSVSLRWFDDAGVYHESDRPELASELKAPWCWVDLSDPSSQDIEPFVSLFGLHELAVEDALHPQARPKIDLDPDGAFLAWLTPRIDGDGGLTSYETDFVVTSFGILTVHDGSGEVISEVASVAQEIMARGSDRLLHAILDRLVDEVIPLADSLGDRLEEIELAMLAPGGAQQLDALYRLRRQLLEVHRMVSPERDLLRALTRERDLVSDEMYRYFDDVIDHLTHAAETLETYRDIGSAVMDIHLSAQSNRLNEVMKVLTVATVIIGVLTLVSGVYGMNLLDGMWPPYEAFWGFPAVVGFMVLTGIIMTTVFRRKGWW